MDADNQDDGRLPCGCCACCGCSCERWCEYCKQYYTGDQFWHEDNCEERARQFELQAGSE